MAFSNTLQITLQSPRSAAFTIVKGYAYDVAVASPLAEYSFDKQLYYGQHV